mgnify:CR=1 FL=1|jgi:hypothetical protein
MAATEMAEGDLSKQAQVVLLGCQLMLFPCCCNLRPTGVFDVKAVRRALETRVKALEAEKQQVRRGEGSARGR